MRRTPLTSHADFRRLHRPTGSLNPARTAAFNPTSPAPEPDRPQNRTLAGHQPDRPLPHQTVFGAITLRRPSWRPLRRSSRTSFRQKNQIGLIAAILPYLHVPSWHQYFRRKCPNSTGNSMVPFLHSNVHS
ncbi:Hypothetical predicted protein [Pelobates cultripes]|uniref:Uncharacterized protein n=1 Tax=Pelobates cultripes TaxID=61616 RepID=A0AAD1VVR1_PELCU|nr:Hypothetical predicted protein [Pelobates cultripes]